MLIVRELRLLVGVIPAVAWPVLAVALLVLALGWTGLSYSDDERRIGRADPMAQKVNAAEELREPELLPAQIPAVSP